MTARCFTPVEPYSGEPVTTKCERPPVPETGAPQSFPFLLVLGFAVLLVGAGCWWVGRVRKYR